MHTATKYAASELDTGITTQRRRFWSPRAAAVLTQQAVLRPQAVLRQQLVLRPQAVLRSSSSEAELRWPGTPAAPRWRQQQGKGWQGLPDNASSMALRCIDGPLLLLEDRGFQQRRRDTKEPRRMLTRRSCPRASPRSLLR